MRISPPSATAAAACLKGEPVDGEVAVVTKVQAEEADYNLSPCRWAGQSEDAEAGSVPALICELENLGKQDALITSELLRLLRPQSIKEGH
ncbi:hypothetical protein [Niveispirillum sp. SYP-B3756]|uniref:hypothetical protein n=1 Tax=Niveispirillum sp. SYP-B3756 TaxID=2662178 RepID=UPI001B3BD80E|nr:hypothetical protein [Niveispirillum sp. SYP-B3756]